MRNVNGREACSTSVFLNFAHICVRVARSMFGRSFRSIGRARNNPFFRRNICKPFIIIIILTILLYYYMHNGGGGGDDDDTLYISLGRQPSHLYIGGTYDLPLFIMRSLFYFIFLFRPPRGAVVAVAYSRDPNSDTCPFRLSAVQLFDVSRIV